MTTSKLKLMPREQFGALSLHEKNAYLQQLADDFAQLHERENVVLDKDALSRLRRYYSRRVWADLKLDDGIGPLNRALRSLGENIRNSSIEADVTGALLSETTPKRVLRTPPQDYRAAHVFRPGPFTTLR